MVTNLDGNPWNWSGTDDTTQYAAIVRTRVDRLVEFVDSKT